MSHDDDGSYEDEREHLSQMLIKFAEQTGGLAAYNVDKYVDLLIAFGRGAYDGGILKGAESLKSRQVWVAEGMLKERERILGVLKSYVGKQWEEIDVFAIVEGREARKTEPFARVVAVCRCCSGLARHSLVTTDPTAAMNHYKCDFCGYLTAITHSFLYELYSGSAISVPAP